ncbi:ca(2)-dependent phospholipid-binding protein (Copine) family [Artemisia annua]|uniref:Ca(2)-dependent phospholipid-binding protein (Copine) family n=1 Tax=Artemisia annua TaxID=35608 RepID=A0A2U1KX86_ARTAN|nr:ca(2)-dependent phospholipid-binding protein (Copine) family [Artemisia annua]
MGNLLSRVHCLGAARKTSASTHQSSSQRRASFNLKVPSFSSSKSEKGIKNKYEFIPDNYSSLEQVTKALRESGLESSNLILGIDFTKSNEWTGKVSFNNRSLHAIGDSPNPYEKAISIIGETLAPFDDDNMIPCFGFGDATTHDQDVFSFHDDGSSCHGFEEVLSCYKRVVANVQLAGPTSYAPVVNAAIDIVEKSGGQFHILVIIADGQVTRGINTGDGELSLQEQNTISSIVEASLYPLVIVLVGVGDGPWDDMRRFDDKIPRRGFDNFQFVNFTSIMSSDLSTTLKEAAFALAALMEIPIQYEAITELGLLGHVTRNARRIIPRPPPRPRGRTHVPGVNNPSPNQDDENKTCPICLTNDKDMAFGCGHMQDLLSCDSLTFRIATGLSRLWIKIASLSYMSPTNQLPDQALYGGLLRFAIFEQPEDDQFYAAYT